MYTQYKKNSIELKHVQNPPAETIYYFKRELLIHAHAHAHAYAYLQS